MEGADREDGEWLIIGKLVKLDVPAGKQLQSFTDFRSF